MPQEIPQSQLFTVMKEEWSPTAPRLINMIRNGTEKKLLHAKALLKEERKPVTVLVDTGSSCTIIQRGYCKKHGLVVQPCKKELTGFNGSTSLVVGMVNVLVAVGKWKAMLPFYVLDYGV